MDKRLSKRTIAVFALLATIFAAGWFVLARTTFLSRTVMNYAKPMIEKKLKSTLVSSPLTGNPITGYRLEKTALVRDGEELLSADELVIRFAPVATICNLSPKINMEVRGLKTSIDKFNRLIPHSSDPNPSNIVIKVVDIHDSTLDTPFGPVWLDNSSAEINNSQNYETDLCGKLAETVDFNLKGGVKKHNGNWTADKLKLVLDKGSTKIDGALYPNTNAEISTDEFNLSRLAEIFPQARRYGIRGILTSKLNLTRNGKELVTDGKMSLKNALVYGMPLEQLSAKWIYDKGVLDASFNDEKQESSAITGTLNFDSSRQYLKTDLSTQKLQLAKLTEELKKQLDSVKALPQGTVSGAKIKLDGPLNALKGSISLLPSEINYGGMLFKDIKGEAKFDGKPSGDVNFSAVHNGKTMSLKGPLSFAENVPTNLKFSAGSLNLEELYPLVPALKKLNARGSLSIDAAVTGLVRNWKLNGKVTSKQLSADKVGAVSALAVDGNYLLGNGNVELKSLSALWGPAKISASGLLDNSKQKRDVNLSGRISNLPTEKLHEFLKFVRVINLKTNLNADFRVSGPISNPRVDANLNANGGSLMKGLVLNSASSKLVYQDNKIIGEPLTITTPEGTLQSRVESIVRGGTNWSWEATVDRLAMRVINGLFGMHEDIKGRMSGKIRLYSIGQGMHWTGDFEKSAFLWRTFRFDSFTGKANGTKDTVNLDHMNFEICGGKGTVNGTVGIGKSLATSMINADINASKINIYEVVRRHIPKIHNIQGLAMGHGRITGSISDPVFTGKATLSPLRISIGYIPTLDTDLTATLHKVQCENLRAKFPEGTAEGSAMLLKSGDDWQSKIKLTGSDIDLKKTLLFASDTVRNNLAGKINFTLESDSPLREFMAKGEVTSPLLEVKDLSIEKLKAPYYYADNYFVVEDLGCETNSGNIAGGFAYDTKTNRWGANCDIKDLDIEKAYRDVLPDMKGKLTGKAEMKLRVGGFAARMGSINATGTLTATDGEIDEFSFLESVKKKYLKGKPLRFKKFQTLFRYDNDTLILLPGTQAIAPAGDPVYRMAMADGYITRKGDLFLTCLGKFNIRALNSLLGGVSGLVDLSKAITSSQGASVSSREVIQNVLGGVLGGATRSSFRYVTLGFGGTIKSPKLTKLLVEADSNRMSSGSGIPTSSSDPDERKMKLDGDWTVNFHFEIPVGYGKNSESGDFSGQFMQNALKGLISNINF